MQRVIDELRRKNKRLASKVDGFKAKNEEKNNSIKSNICNRCAVHIDHHCPRLNNCVGHHNHTQMSSKKNKKRAGQQSVCSKTHGQTGQKSVTHKHTKILSEVVDFDANPPQVHVPGISSAINTTIDSDHEQPHNFALNTKFGNKIKNSFNFEATGIEPPR